jgi:uncharacterized membrane protein YwaF
MVVVSTLILSIFADEQELEINFMMYRCFGVVLICSNSHQAWRVQTGERHVGQILPLMHKVFQPERLDL